MATIVSTLLMLSGIFMILLILVQRGRGGGLAGAFGGMGGQSAFGTKAGDVFTKITVGVALVWVLLAGASIRLMDAASSGNYRGGDDAAAVGASAGAGDSETEDSTGTGLAPTETSDDTDSESEKTEESTETETAPAEKSTEKPASEESSTEKPATDSDK
ncbi:MAG: preprotein translocase subunit SecG [Planctomycetaceae bacterium]|jgi:preprotein translocase subunit SecG|nr:preprotein translocase subunit SecG [Planctomycetaceae bacterium]